MAREKKSSQTKQQNTADISVSPLEKNVKKKAVMADQPAIKRRRGKRGIVTTDKVYLDSDVVNQLQHRFIAFDVETTGLNPNSDRIVELGAVLFENGKVTKRYGTLVNPGKSISFEASEVNHITNAMVRQAPKQLEIYPSFVEFMGDSFLGKTIICAHNADFDIGFLSNTLERLGYDAQIVYVDTLAMSRAFLHLENYRQETVAKYFGIVNKEAHRAESDAITCGQILWRILQLPDLDLEAYKKRIDAHKPSDDELDVCALVQNSIMKHGGDLKYISFYKDVSGYVSARCQYVFARLKTTKNGMYIIIPDKIQTPENLPIERCTMSEGCPRNKRMYFSSPLQLKFLSLHFWNAFQNAYKDMKYFIQHEGTERDVLQQVKNGTKLTPDEVVERIKKASTKQYAPLPNPFPIKKIISREEVSVHPVNNRNPLPPPPRTSKELDRGFKIGTPLWEEGEEHRKDGDLQGALALYDQAREAGYIFHTLYRSYALVYRQLRDYENEIAILEECMERLPWSVEMFIARRDKAVELLYYQQHMEKPSEPPSVNKECAPGIYAGGRPILQMSDEGEVLCEYPSTTQASRSVGVSTKGIRSSAQGLQRHAGGYVWKYKDECPHLGEGAWPTYNKQENREQKDDRSSEQRKEGKTEYQLSAEQKEFVRKALDGQNLLVDACIGSGKTTAVQHLCEAYPSNKRILYLTYNRLLKMDAQLKIKRKNVTVTNYHGYAYSCLGGNKRVGVSDLIQTFIHEKPMIAHYDVLIIDEYQDIEQEFADMLEMIKEANPGIQIVAVGDMQQKIYDRTTLNVREFISDFLGDYSVLEFTNCFRLSAEHAEMLGRIWKKKIIGTNSDCQIQMMSEDEIVDFLSNQDPCDVLCLGQRNGQLTTVQNRLEEEYSERYNKNTVYASISDGDSLKSSAPTPNSAIFTTYDSSKGLERKIVVIFDWTESYWKTRAHKPQQSYEILRNIFCVAASRGKEHIIFVQSNEAMLSEDLLSHPIDGTERFENLEISDMFDFKYKEDIEECYSLLSLTEVKREDHSVINIRNLDGLIDLSPCIGIYQEARFFDGYNIDDSIQFHLSVHKDKKYLYGQEFRRSTLEKKILFLTSLETGQNRYRDQVKIPFIGEKERQNLVTRLSTVFHPEEEVQNACAIHFSDKRNGHRLFSALGMMDVVKNETVYELKFVSELQHEHFLQCACYMVATGIKKGVLWNVRTNEMYEIRIPNKAKFLDAVTQTVTKGVIKKYHKPDPSEVIVYDMQIHAYEKQRRKW